MQLKNEGQCEINMLSGDNKYTVWGLCFFNKNRNNIKKDFDKDIDILLKNNIMSYKKSNKTLNKNLNKKLAAHIDIGKMTDMFSK